MADRLLGAEHRVRPPEKGRLTAYFNLKEIFSPQICGKCGNRRSSAQPIVAAGGSREHPPAGRPGGPAVAVRCGHLLSSGFTSGINQWTERGK